MQEIRSWSFTVEYSAEGYHNRSFNKNALTVDMALGCSTNTMLHLPLPMKSAWNSICMANEYSAKTPNLCHLKPCGPTYMDELNEAGGVYAVMNELSTRIFLSIFPA